MSEEPICETTCEPTPVPPLQAEMPAARGLKCPNCDGAKLYVNQVKPLTRGSVKRYRRCRTCGFRVRTLERIVPFKRVPKAMVKQ